MTWYSAAHDERRTVSRAVLALLISALAVFFLLLAYPRQDGHLVSSDGAYYYSYLRSAVLDGDLDIRNDIDLYNSRMPAGSPDRLGMGWAYAFSIGPGLLNLPGFLVARGIVLLASTIGLPIATDGFSYVEEAAFCIGNLIMGAFGLYLLALALTRVLPAGSVLPGVLYAVYGGSVLAYLYLETWMSHAPELLGVGLVVYLVLRGPGSTRDWLLAGAALGLAFLLRWQDAVFVVLLAAYFRPYERNALRHGAAVAGGFLAVAALQLLFWKATSGAWVLVPQGASFLGLQHTHVLEALFSTRHGMLVWTPVLALALVGLAFVRPARLRYAMILVFLLQLGVATFNEQWWAGNSFGMRRLIGATPVFALGLAALPRMRGPRATLRPLVLACVFWTCLFFVQYALHLIPRDGELNAYQLFVQKLELPVLIVEKLAGGR